MFCGKCGNQVPDEVKFCPNCGTAAATQASEQPQQQQPYQQQPYPQQPYPQQPYQQQPYQQPPYGQQPYYQAPPPPPEPDVPSTGLNVASFFIPLIGIIIYATSHQQTPIKAKAALKWSLISVAFWIVFGIVVGGLVPLLLMRSFSPFS